MSSSTSSYTLFLYRKKCENENAWLFVNDGDVVLPEFVNDGDVVLPGFVNDEDVVHPEEKKGNCNEL